MGGRQAYRRSVLALCRALGVLHDRQLDVEPTRCCSARCAGARQPYALISPALSASNAPTTPRPCAHWDRVVQVAPADHPAAASDAGADLARRTAPPPRRAVHPPGVVLRTGAAKRSTPHSAPGLMRSKQRVVAALSAPTRHYSCDAFASARPWVKPAPALVLQTDHCPQGERVAYAFGHARRPGAECDIESGGQPRLCFRCACCLAGRLPSSNGGQTRSKTTRGGSGQPEGFRSSATPTASSRSATTTAPLGWTGRTCAWCRRTIIASPSGPAHFAVLVTCRPPRSTRARTAWRDHWR